MYVIVGFTLISLMTGSKESVLRMLYALLAISFLLFPNYVVPRNRILGVAPLIVLVGVLGAVLGHLSRAYLVTGELSWSTGGGGDTVQAMFNFLLARLMDRLYQQRNPISMYVVIFDMCCHHCLTMYVSLMKVQLYHQNHFAFTPLCAPGPF